MAPRLEFGWWFTDGACALVFSRSLVGEKRASVSRDLGVRKAEETKLREMECNKLYGVTRKSRLLLSAAYPNHLPTHVVTLETHQGRLVSTACTPGGFAKWLQQRLSPRADSRQDFSQDFSRMLHGRDWPRAKRSTTADLTALQGTSLGSLFLPSACVRVPRRTNPTVATASHLPRNIRPKTHHTAARNHRENPPSGRVASVVGNIRTSWAF